MSVPNQKTIKLARRTPRDSEHLYAMTNIDALQAAMQALNGSGLKLWLYLNKNQDGYRFELSRVECAKWGIKKDSYYSAVQELIDKGFLVQDHIGSSLFWFHETAVAEKPKTFSEMPTEIAKNPKEMLENTERNITENTEILQNKTLSDDTADGGIVDCGGAAIHNGKDFDERMKRWFGSFAGDKTFEDPNALISKYF